MRSPIDENAVLLPDYWAPSDWIEHVPFVCWLVAASRPRSYVELGAGAGMGYFAVCQTVARNALPTHCHAVADAGETETADEDPSLTVEDHNQVYFPGFSQILRMPAEQAAEALSPGSVDILNLGAASAEDPERLLALWSDRLSQTGVVILPGIAEGGPLAPRRRLWQDLSAAHPAFEFPHQGGLGIVAGPETPPALAAFLVDMQDPAQAATMRRVFATLGRNLAARAELRVLRRDADQLEHVARAEVAELSEEKDRAEAALKVLQTDLARARSRPMGTLWDWLRYRMLTRLAGFSPPIPARTAARFRRSAEKRNPKRSLPGFKAPEPRSDRRGGTKQNSASAATDGTSRSVDPAKRTVLVVSHEASRTGAPILAWNLATALSETCNVVNLILRGGDLREHFQAAGVALYETDYWSVSQSDMTRLVREICARHPIAYALVNSVESRKVLPGLRECGVPTIALLHEFAANTRPSTAFPDVLKQADQVVFSTRMTLENAISTCGITRSASIHILPQGKCRIPGETDAKQRHEERRWLESVLRPGGAEDREFVVIGAGAVDARKAVDLFIECATRVSQAEGGARFRFVWIGHGYDPEKDTTASIYLADQMSRAGIQAQMRIVRSTSEIEHAYRLADLLLLSSRLDPLPNVAIDALIAGTPVICFDRTTGIADFLARNGLGDACVVPYLDTSAMARKILDLAADDAARSEVARRGQEAALRDFDFARYVAELDAMAQQVLPLERRIAEDAAFLRGQEAFRPDFFCSHSDRRLTEPEAIEAYLRASWSGTALRKPMPGFHPGISAERYDAASGEEPFVRFLKDGRPAGPWSFPVISTESPAALPAAGAPRLALHVHAFYVDQVDEILARLGRNTSRPDLFVSAPTDRLSEAEEAVARYSGRVVAVEGVPNRGRDIGPFLTAFGPRLAGEYDIVGHIHTKKSTDYKNPRAVEAWKTFLLENLLGGPKGGAMLDRIVTAMAADPSIAIAYPDDPHVMGWTANRGAAENLARRLRRGTLPDQFNFPIGTMFWLRADLLRQFVALDLDWTDYPAEPVPYDGSMLHALERLFGVLPDLAGMRTAVTNVTGVSR